MEELFSFRELRKAVDEIENAESKILFLEKYLSFYPSTGQEIRAKIYDLLGDLFIEKGVSKPHIFVEAASAWEGSWLKLINHKHSKFTAWTYLRNALDSYRIAYDMFKKKDDSLNLHKINSRINDVKSQMRKYNPFPKKACSLMIFASFILSIAFFSYNFTGFAIAEINEGQSIWLGGMFFLISLVGLAFLVKFWD